MQPHINRSLTFHVALYNQSIKCSSLYICILMSVWNADNEIVHIISCFSFAIKGCIQSNSIEFEAATCMWTMSVSIRAWNANNNVSCWNCLMILILIVSCTYKTSIVGDHCFDIKVQTNDTGAWLSSKINVVTYRHVSEFCQS